MRPVADEFETSQEFGGGATAGVRGNPDPNSGMAYYVWLYGNYQEFGHAGKDIACPIGTPIHAPADGTVLYAGWVEDLPGNGNVRKWLLYYNFGGIVTVIQHAGWISVIAHQSDNDAVSVGMQVKEGQLIGKSGNTKTRTTTVAPHVHIEALVYLDYRTNVSAGIIYGRVDPTPFFGGIAAQGSITPTPSEEDDMALFVNRDDFKAAVVEAVFNARYDTRDEKNVATGTITLKDFLTYYPANVALDRKQLTDGLTASVASVVKAVKAGQTVDPAAVAKEIAAELDGITLKVVTEGAK